jgi:hypothetical protein
MSESRRLGGFARSGLRMGTLPVSLLLGLAAFGVYWRTLAVSIVWGDSAELTAAAYCAGVPHPTGYPLYMLLGHALARLVPWGSPAYRMNLLSALAGALAVALLYPLLLRFTRSRAASAAMTLTFAFIPLYWSHAVITEVYTLHILGMVAVMNCVLAWDRRGDRRWLWAAALAYGLCFTHHLLSVLLAPGLLLFALTSRQRRSFLAELRFTLPLFLLPFLLYLYVPLAAWRDTPMNWGDARTWENFLAHVTGRQYRHVMFALSSPQLAGNCREYARSLVEQFPVELLWLAPVGAWRLTRRRPRLGALALLIYLAQTIYALNYQISDIEVYYLPSHLMVALWIGCGLGGPGGGP